MPDPVAPVKPKIVMTPQERRISRLYIKLLRAQYTYLKDRSVAEIPDEIKAGNP